MTDLIVHNYIGATFLKDHTLMNSYHIAVFKRLAHNDCASAPGHQGGVLIPKDLEGYFPKLSGNVTAAHPTVDAWIKATLLDGSSQVGSVQTRYQYQTWTAKRSPERRLTSNLGSLLYLAKKDDILLIERSESNPLEYRITLHRAGTVDFNKILTKIGHRRWGKLI